MKNQFMIDKNFTGDDRMKLIRDLINDISRWAAGKKTEHEIPNKNGTDYNRGYVAAMNDVMNLLKAQ